MKGRRAAHPFRSLPPLRSAGLRAARRGSRGLAGLAAVACALGTGEASAEPSRALRGTTDVRLGVESGAILSAWVVGNLLSGERSKDRCAWCEPSAFDRKGHDALAVEGRRTAALVSHVPSFVLLPFGGLAGVVAPALHRGERRDAVENGWIYTNGFLLTLAVTDTTKRAVARRRPVFLFGRAKDSEFDTWPSEENLSFFSGDTACAFEFAASSATIAFLRGYRTAPLLASVGGALATSTALLRVASEAHWPSDVLTGAAIGTVIGVGFPLLAHGRVAKATGDPAAAGAPMVSMGGAF